MRFFKDRVEIEDLKDLNDDALLSLHSQYLQVANVTEKFVQSIEDGLQQFEDSHPIKAVLYGMLNGAAHALGLEDTQAAKHVNAIKAEMQRRDEAS